MNIDDFDREYDVGYLNRAIEADGIAGLLVGLSVVAKKHGIGHVAEKAGMARENIHRSLAEDGNPTVRTLDKILGAVGVRLSVAASERTGKVAPLLTSDTLVEGHRVFAVAPAQTKEVTNMDALTDREDIEAHYDLLVSALRIGATRHTPFVSWPGGTDSGVKDVYWHEGEGYWSLAETFPGGMWFGFGTTNPTTQTIIVPELQLAFASEGVNRRRAGVLSRDANGNVFAAHKGQFTVYHSRTSAEDFIQSHPGQTVARINWPDGVQGTYIIVAGVSEKTTVQRIGDFVRTVRDYKNALRETNH